MPAGLPEDWIDRLKANDEQVLKAIYVACYGKVETYVLENSGTKADAEDIFHEAFIAAWRNVQLDRVALSSFDKLQGYLFRIAQFKWLDHLRTAKRHKLELPPALMADDSGYQLQADEEEYLQKIVSSYELLGEPCKSVLHRFYFLKQTMQEIAAAFTWTEATAKNNKYRCLQRLRNAVLTKKSTP